MNPLILVIVLVFSCAIISFISILICQWDVNHFCEVSIERLDRKRDDALYLEQYELAEFYRGKMVAFEEVIKETERIM